MQFEILGPMRVTVSGQAVRIGSARQRAVLAVLLLAAGRTVSVDRLIDAVWGDQPADSALNLVRTYVWRLRALLTEDGEPRLETEPAGYLLRVKPGELDLGEFERLAGEGRAALARDEPFAAARQLREALDLWRGEPLADVTLHGADLAAETLRLAESRVAVLEERVEADLALGRHEELVSELRQYAAQHPLRERITGSLMVACYRSGRQADALAAYRALRSSLVDELGVEPGPAVRELHERILNADPELREGRVARPLSARRTPRQLPAAPGHFTGRSEELGALKALALHGEQPVGTVVICAIDGMGGIGKTALALQAAHLLADRYPDGQLFLDLHGYTKGMEPRDPAEALAVILQSLGVPSRQIPPALDARAALYRDRLADTRTLILLDNAASDEQIQPLLPGGSRCTVLITSRTRLRSLDDAYTVPLDLLPVDHAVTLLRAMAGPRHSAVDDAVFGRIAELCGRLPLALRIAGGLLRRRPAWTAEHLIEKLKEGGPGLGVFRDAKGDLTGVFDLSYRTLPEGRQLLFRRLGLLPGPDTDAYAIAALLGCEADEAEEALQDLVDQHLLIEPVFGRYQMHDLIRQHTQKLAEQDAADERAEALNRLMDYYQHASQRADAWIARYPKPVVAGPVPAHAPEFADAEQAIAWLRAERANVQACVQSAAARAQDHRVVGLVAGLEQILREDGPRPYAVDLHTIACQAAERLDDPALLSRTLIALGAAKTLSLDFPGAQEALNRAIALSLEQGDRGGLAVARSERSVVLRMSGDLDGALRELDQAIAGFAELDEPLGQAAAYTELGLSRYLSGNAARAAKELAESLRLYRRIGDRRGQAKAVGMLGGIQHSIGESQPALVSLAEALALYREFGDSTGEANILIELSSAYREIGDLKSAKRYVDDGLRILRENRVKLGIAIAVQARATISRTDGDLPAAIRDFEEALAAFRESGARGNEAWVLNGYAEAVHASGDPKRALDLYREALDLAREAAMRNEQALALEGIGEVLLADGDRAEGVAHLTEALDLCRELEQRADADRIEDRLAQLA